MYAPILKAAKAAPPTNASRQLLAVSASFPETSRAFHKISWPSSVPVIVIVSEKTPFEAPEDAKVWRDAHQEFAAIQIFTMDRLGATQSWLPLPGACASLRLSD